MKTAIVLCLTFLFISSASAQDFSIARSPDTLSFRDLTFPRATSSFLQPVILVPSDQPDSVVVNNLPPGFLRASMLLEPYDQQPTGPLSPLRYQALKHDHWGILFTALGYAEAGTATYFTYRALKKYGYIR